MAANANLESMLSALAKAVAKAGSQSALARSLGVSQNAVSKWVRNRRPLPAKHVLKVEAETGISRHELRHDLYPDESGNDAAGHDRPRPATDSTFGQMEPAR